MSKKYLVDTEMLDDKMAKVDGKLSGMLAVSGQKGNQIEQREDGIYVPKAQEYDDTEIKKRVEDLEDSQVTVSREPDNQAEQIDDGLYVRKYDDTQINNEISDLRSYIGYTDSDIAGLCADFENNQFTRLAGAVGLKAGADFDKFNAFGGRKRCIVQDNGTILALRDDNAKTYTLTNEGKNVITTGVTNNQISVTAAEDGTYGQVMVYQPKFYYKVVPLKFEPVDGGVHGYKLRKENYYVSDTPKAGFKLHPAFISDGKERDYILLSAYEGCIYDVSALKYLLEDEQVADFTATTGDKLSSIANAKPCSGATQKFNRAAARQLAHNRGEGWELGYTATIAASQLLMIIEYATFNMQTAIGKGVVNRSSGETVKTGDTGDLGNKSGTADGTDGVVSVSYRGEENIWGNCWEFVEGAIAFAKDNRVSLYIANNRDFKDVLSDDYELYSAGLPVNTVNQHISSFIYNEKYDYMFVPSEAQGNSINPVGDIYRTSFSQSSPIVPACSGGCYNGIDCGPFMLMIINEVSSSFGSSGNARIVYIPKPSEEVTL